MKRLILASQSQRRRDLLTAMHLNFDVISSNYEEDMSLDLSPVELVTRFAKGKALDVAQNHPDSVIIGADVILYTDKRKYGKPKDKQEAENFLRELSDSEINIITGYAIIDLNKNKEIIDTDLCTVQMRKLTEKEIFTYLQKEEYQDKAGALAFQGMAMAFAKEMTGNFSNILGLPIYKLIRDLKQFGINPFDE
jgi:septum formation protein